MDAVMTLLPGRTLPPVAEGVVTLSPEAELTRAEIEQHIKEDPEKSLAIIGIMLLTEVVKQSQAITATELIQELTGKTTAMRDATGSHISVVAGCQLFLRFARRTISEYSREPDLERCKSVLITQGEKFVQNSAASKMRIAELGEQFIQDGDVLLVHSISRPVLKVILRAAEANKRVTVYVTESRPTKSGYRMAAALAGAGIPCHVILDAAVGYFIQRMDLVLVGAEGVVENGGIINQIGTYQMAVLARDANKPFYVAVESYKFVRDFPLNQADIHTALSKTMVSAHPPATQGAQLLTSAVDYTPPGYIALLITELGILTPSAVSDELIQLYG